MFPDKLMVGLELRDKVSEYVRERIENLRSSSGGAYRNISVMRANAQRNLPNYFRKAQLEKMFFLFPDPHFKAHNHRRRIISQQLLTEYAYLMKVGATLYTITDVEELGKWMRDHLDEHPLFERIPDDELAEDPCTQLIELATEEGQKVERNNGQVYKAIYRRVAGLHDK
uniref:tRNA (guanine(46)-N(7))-methyltransferase n=1 Tax=Tetraselmis sp. GSL018 TaxID=582737 RepID=A0A061RMN5_9CHLO|eukprot:CAMPEP_0177607176 /NCGR_PEP_ID=MMETSP0419_2-20121207/17764_1 /TAXON_ID=582737 /ORGANISM="Tetraselmis sp., Strain GSL018" /LENGTH=169 /DNA_ID=CAMNT_0019101713 /DNA_START=1239 /DNA_END=1748 /DNA_ORIENTATION=-